MSSRRDELATTILRMIANGNLGTDATGYFAKLDDIIEEIGDKQNTKSIINNYLLPKTYIRKINDKFKSIHNHELEYTAYQITELGRTYLTSQHIMSASPSTFVGVTNNNLIVGSENYNRIINRLDQLISQADEVLATHTPNPPNVIGFATLSTVKFQKWKASSENIITAICGLNNNYLENFKKETKRGGHRSCVNAGKGILLALKEDIEAGIYATEPTVRASDISQATVTSDTVSLKISNDVYVHIRQYLDTEDYFHAVEEAYKVVREKLRSIIGKEKATDIFNMNAENVNYHQEIFGRKAKPDTPEADFFRGIGYLNLAIQFLRNEKTHSLATTLDKNLAIHYISLASLAYDLISGSDEK